MADVALAFLASPYIHAYPWAEGFGTKYTNPSTLPTGSGWGVAFCGDTDVAVAHGTTPFISAYPWTLGTGFGTKYSNPATLPSPAGFCVAFCGETDVAVGMPLTPFVTAYPWTPDTGFGTKYANPGTLPAGQGKGVAFCGSTDIAVAHYNSPYITTYNWTPDTGFGSKHSNPGILPTGLGLGVDFWGVNGIAVSHATTPFVSAYPWTPGTGFATKQNDPGTLPPGTGQSVAFGGTLGIAVAHTTTPYVTSYPYTVDGFGTKYTNPGTTPTGDGRGVAFYGSLDVAVAHLSSPYITAYPWSLETGFGTKYGNPSTLPTMTGSHIAFTPAAAITHEGAATLSGSGTLMATARASTDFDVAKDAELFMELPDTNAGSATDLQFSYLANVRIHILLEVDLSAAGKSAEDINTASLNLYVWAIVGDASSLTYTIHRVTRPGDWPELEVTWNDYKDATPWTSAGGDYSSPTKDFSGPSAEGEWFVVDVTDLVKDAFDNRSGILSLIVTLPGVDTPYFEAWSNNKGSGLGPFVGIKWNVFGQAALAGEGTLVAVGSVWVPKLLAGALTPVGVLSRMTSKPSLGGSFSSSGAVPRKVSKFPSGVLTPSGALGTVWTQVKGLAGVLTSGGALSRKTVTSLAGAILVNSCDISIGASADDGELWPPNDWPAGHWSNTTWFAELGSDIYGWWHWPNIPLPKNANLKVAKIHFHCWSSESDACDLRIEGCDEDDSAALTSWPDYASRPKTSLVEWNDVEPWGINQWYWSADIKSIFETVTSREGWSPGQAIQVIIKGLVPVAEACRDASAYDGGVFYGHPEWAAVLHLEWNVGALSTVTTWARTLTGALTSAGALSTVATWYRALAGALTLAGILSTITTWGRTFAGTLTSSGTLVGKATKVLVGTLSSSGVVVRKVSTAFAGALSASGTLTPVKQIVTAYKTLEGTLSSAGNLVRKTQTALVGTLTTSGVVVTVATWYEALAGTLTSSGGLTRKAIPATLAGALTSSGVLVAKAGKVLGGTLTSAGLLATTLYKATYVKALAGTLMTAGALGATALTLKALAGALTSSGALTTIRTQVKSLAGDVTFAGAIVRTTVKGLVGTFTPAGNVFKKSWYALAGVVSFAGGLIGTLIGIAAPPPAGTADWEGPPTVGSGETDRLPSARGEGPEPPTEGDARREQ